jgi:hypothetical protein
MKSILYLSMLLLFSLACSSLKHSATRNKPRYFPGYEQLTAMDKQLADSIVALALDQEGIYTILGRIKPVSSIGYSLKYPLAKDSTMVEGSHEVVNLKVDSIRQFVQEIEQLHRITERLSSEELTFLLIPFRETYDKNRHLQLLVCRQDLIDSTLAVHQPFFAQWGFTPGTDPGTLITALEFEEMADRYRAYGYLFGYPKYAVDFFVEAFLISEQGGEFVKRDFFHIPVFEREQGRFTYAIPKDHKPDHTDSLIYHRSIKVLERYKESRSEFINDEKMDINAFLKYWFD